MKNFITHFLNNSIKSKQDLILVINQAARNHIIDNDNLPIIEAVINISNLRAKDIMLPRSEISLFDVDDMLEKICTQITDTGHSRFPVIDGEISNIVGIFHSKDIIH